MEQYFDCPYTPLRRKQGHKYFNKYFNNHLFFWLLMVSNKSRITKYFIFRVDKIILRKFVQLPRSELALELTTATDRICFPHKI
jgi:hypothetical protein